MLVLAIIVCIGMAAGGYLLSRRSNRQNAGYTGGNQRNTYSGNSVSRSTQMIETGPMVYYANDYHGNGDREYRFNYKKVDGKWRAYILRMPNLGNRDAGGIVTHRFWDGSNSYVCWDRPVNSLKDMQNISRIWADCIQEYIATGKKFGPQ